MNKAKDIRWTLTSLTSTEYNFTKARKRAVAIIKQEVPIQLDRDLIIKEGINWYRPRIKSKGKVMFIAPTQKEKWKTTNTFLLKDEDGI